MNNCIKRISFAFLSLLIILFMTSVFAKESFAAAKSKGASPIIAVFPFNSAVSPELQQTQGDFTSLLQQRISAKGLSTIPADKVRNLISSKKISTLDIKTVRTLARSLGANYAVYGNISQIGNTITVDARFVPVDEKQEVRPFLAEQATLDSLAPVTEDLASNVARQFMKSDVVDGVEVKGTTYLDPDVVLLRINTRKGDRVDPAEIDREIKSIWDLGYFSDVRVDIENRPSGKVIVYTVKEKPKVENISIQGSGAIDEDDILSVMGTKVGGILNEKILSEDIQKILELYRKKGYYLARVEQTIDSRSNGVSAQVNLKIDEGKKLYISKVIIDGANQLSESDVRSQMLLTERGMFSWITGSGVLKEELIERDSSAISSYYLDNGFLDITVGVAQTDYTDDGIVVTFPISEGKRYRLNEIIFAGDLIEPESKLETLIKSSKMAKNKDYFNLSVMQEDARNLSAFYSDYGYAYVDVNPRPEKLDGEAAIVDIVFQIDKNNKMYIGKVTVEGNTKTRENVILREMRLTDGEEFDGSKLRRSSERLNRLGYFELAEIELVPTGKDDEVDLKVKVQERPTGAVMAGFGYSTFSQFGVSGTIMERNLWGKGYEVALQAGFSGRRTSYTFSFTNPRWDDTPLSVGFDVYHWRDDYIDYRKTTTGGIARFAYPLGEYTSFGWGYRLDQYKIYDLDDDVSDLIRDYSEERRYSSVALAKIVRDSTDRDRPTSGNIDKIGVEYGGGVMGGDDDFITLTAEHQTYVPLADRHTLHGRIKGSTIFNNGSKKVPVFERFWMGGIDTVRGYNSRDIVPRDPKTGDRIGGTRMAFANLEYIWTVSNEFGLNFVPFFDIGVNIDADNHYKIDDEIYRAYGAELRWRSPMGDLRFAYGIPLDKDRKGDRSSGRFEFSMGKFF